MLPPATSYALFASRLSAAFISLQTTLTPSAAPSSAVRIQPHPVYDSTEYQSLQHLVSKTSTEGLYGGVRLLTVNACAVFLLTPLLVQCRMEATPLRYGFQYDSEHVSHVSIHGQARAGWVLPSYLVVLPSPHGPRACLLTLHDAPLRSSDAFRSGAGGK